MGALRWTLIAAAMIIPGPVDGQSQSGDSGAVARAPAKTGVGSRWSQHVAEAATRFGIPQSWIWRVMAIESAGRAMRNGRPIRSPKGAMGLMQLMPDTWRAMRMEYGLGNDPDDPRDNIMAGAAYLRRMYDRFGYPGLFAAYNAGPTRYAAYLGGRALPTETVNYQVATGGPAAFGTRIPIEPNTEPAASPRAAPRLFAVSPRSIDTVRGGTPEIATGLFVIRRE